MAKAYFLPNLTPLLIFSVALLLNTAASQWHNFDYDFSSTQVHVDLLFQGDAHLASGTPNLHLTSANPQTDSVGRVVYSNSISFSQLDFATSITFIITSVDKRPGEGLAFFIAPHGTTIPAGSGSGGGNLGVFGAEGSNSNILAIEFDTLYNPEVDATASPHVGIDIESPRSSNVTIVGDALMGQEVNAYITYEHATKKIVVSLTAGSETYVVSYARDLTTLLPQQSQIGISAATGGSLTHHDVVSWSFITFTTDANSNIQQVV